MFRKSTVTKEVELAQEELKAVQGGLSIIRPELLSDGRRKWLAEVYRSILRVTHPVSGY